MVAEGQFLERATLIAVEDFVLEGLSHRGTRTPPLLIIPPPPEQGGMDHVLAAELAWAAAQSGHPELRFNFRGVGASQGGRGGAKTHVADVEAAMRLLTENTGQTRIAIAAIEGGAEIAFNLLKRHTNISGVALLSPVNLDLAKVSRVTAPLLVVMPHDSDQRRAALAEAIAEVNGLLEVVEAADAKYTRGLPHMGRAVTHWLAKL